jgi:hypothetical protein
VASNSIGGLLAALRCGLHRADLLDDGANAAHDSAARRTRYRAPADDEVYDPGWVGAIRRRLKASA